MKNRPIGEGVLRPLLNWPLMGSFAEAHKTSMKPFRVSLSWAGMPGFQETILAGSFARWKANFWDVLFSAFPKGFLATYALCRSSKENCGGCYSFVSEGFLLCNRSYWPPSTPAILDCCGLCSEGVSTDRHRCSLSYGSFIKVWLETILIDRAF